MKRDPSNYDLNMPHPAKALTTPVTSLAVLAFCQHSKLVRSRFHQLEAGKWGGGEDGRMGGRREGEEGRREGRPIHRFLDPGKGTFDCNSDHSKVTGKDSK